MRLWHITLAVPITGYNGDATLNNVVVKDVLDHGWYDANQNLAAPYGQHLYDFSAFSAVGARRSTSTSSSASRCSRSSRTGAFAGFG
jgi:hypothetical protein